MMKSPIGYSTLFHVTPERNFLSIDEKGLVVRKAQGKTKAVWLCTTETLDWALGHVSQHQDTPIEGMVIFAVIVPNTHIRKKRKGIYLCVHDVPRHQLRIVR